MADAEPDCTGGERRRVGAPGIFLKFAFRTAVSDKRPDKPSSAGQARLSGRDVYYYVEKSPEKALTIRPLNVHAHPEGEGRPLTFEDLLERYRPEPLYYYNKVKPVMERVEGLVEAGQASLDAGNTGRAETLFKQALDLDHHNVRAIFGLGFVYLRSGSLDDARHVFRQLMLLPTAFTEEYRHLFNAFGIQMRRRGMLQDARAFYEKALGFGVEDEHLLFNLARAHYAASEFDLARAQVERALNLDPEFDPARRLLKALDKAQDLLPEEFTEPEPERHDLEQTPEPEPLSDAQRYPDLDLDGVPWE
ncbi:hypothetical protein NNJEOMEG_02471 [Fundidesulfovibrio magnetotacticus]|uniref:Tetratricopeptide repeat protein n=1 Tax=Fundidesulfovibrio magnetotacticus TaxID=2730080 RepID=A0A6V8LSA7_9BACT|nr:tetratricopeptide repeat protein [Fundidesulfovibrio magnetotacticus]GFK94624.1 hypothetical protein NNJEOMEG_02471 [Fundidesulfovibrio magnetotacticus]